MYSILDIGSSLKILPHSRGPVVEFFKNTAK
jgi:hypothetical protein